MRVRIAVSALLGVVGLLAACGPSKSTTAIVKAHQAIRRARAADAEKKHPYELAMAREYYIKAKEEAGYSQFELSEKLAKQAIVFAKVAAEEATPTPSLGDEEDSTTP